MSTATQLTEGVPADFVALASHDTAKIDLELVCAWCGGHVCDIESGDDLAILVGVARDHRATECERAEEGPYVW